MNTTRFVLSPLAVATTLCMSGAALAHSAIPPSKYETTLDQLHAAVPVTLSAASSHHIIDLVAFYQPIYAVMLGEEAVHARIAYKVDVANETLQNSGINANINLVAVSPTFGIPDELGFNAPVGYEGHEVTGAQGLFSIYTLNAHPEPDQHLEHEFYTAYGADLATYFRPYRPFLDDGERIGTASQGGEISTIFDELTVNADAIHVDATLIHEIGHNLGAGHEAGVDTFTKDPDAHAYTCDGKNTVMWSAAYRGEQYGGRHLLFSNPNIQRGADWCGVAGEADNSAVLTRNVPAAASRRHAPSVLGDVSLADSSMTVSELDGEFTVNLVRTGDTSEPAAVGVLITGETASTVSDLKQAYQFVEFDAGASTAQATFGVVADAIEQGNMSASVNLVYPQRLNVTNGTADLTITDSPAGNHGEITIEAPTRVNAGDTLTVNLVRTGGLDGELVAQVRTLPVHSRWLPHDALYPLTENVIFADGQERMSFEVPTHLVEDLTTDRTYRFAVQTMGLDDVVYEATTVIDMDSVVTYSVSAASVAANASSAPVTITRTGDVSVPSTVYLSTADGSLNSQDHYVPLSRFVEFGANQSSQAVSIQLRSGAQPGNFNVELDTGASAAVQVTASATNPGDNDEPERKASAIHPVWAGLLMMAALVMRLKRRSVNYV